MYFSLRLIYVGRAETTGEVLKSIMAIFLYRKRVDDLKHHTTDPADFSKYLYQPEKDVNDERIHHREDHNHLLKRIVSRLRGGHIPGIDLMHFKDTLHDATTGVTYEALTGKNKQLVPDCEHLINPGVIAFFEKKGHAANARIVNRLMPVVKAFDNTSIGGMTFFFQKCNHTWIDETFTIRNRLLILSTRYAWKHI